MTPAEVWRWKYIPGGWCWSCYECGAGADDANGSSWRSAFDAAFEHMKGHSHDSC